MVMTEGVLMVEQGTFHGIKQAHWHIWGYWLHVESRTQFCSLPMTSGSLDITVCKDPRGLWLATVIMTFDPGQVYDKLPKPKLMAQSYLRRRTSFLE